MTPDEITAELASTNLFGRLGRLDLQHFARLCDEVQVAPGMVLAAQGQPLDDLYVVLEGQLLLLRTDREGLEETVGYVGPHRTLGARSVLLGESRRETALAVEPLRCLRFEGARLRELVQSRPDLLDGLTLGRELRERRLLAAPAWLAEGEVLVGLYRKHWLALLRGALMPAAVFVAAVLCSLAATLAGAGNASTLALAAVGAALTLAGAVWVYFDWYADQYVITSRRVVHIERTPLIDARRSEAPLERIQDVSVVQPHILARLLGYGTVNIQTAGTAGQITFDLVPRPGEVRQLVFEQVEHALSSKRHAQRQRITQRLRRRMGLELAEGAPSLPESGSAPPQPGEVEQPGLLADTRDLLVTGLGHLLPRMRVQHGEVVIWRKHWWVLLRHTAVLLTAWSVVSALLARALLAPLNGAAILTALWVGLGLALVWQFENWRNDLYVLTNEHIIDIERLPLGFFEHRRQASLAQIQDINYAVPNPLATLLNYGNVFIETAAETGRLTFDMVYNPRGVQEEVFARLDKLVADRRAREERQHEDEMVQWFDIYHRLRAERVKMESDASARGVTRAGPD